MTDTTQKQTSVEDEVKKDKHPSERIRELVGEYYQNNIFQDDPDRVLINAVIRYMDEIYRSEGKL